MSDKGDFDEEIPQDELKAIKETIGVDDDEDLDSEQFVEDYVDNDEFEKIKQNELEKKKSKHSKKHKKDKKKHKKKHKKSKHEGEEKEAQRHKKHKGSDEDKGSDDSDDEEDEDGDENDDYERDDFVVDEIDEDEEEAEYPYFHHIDQPKLDDKKKKLKKKKQKPQRKMSGEEEGEEGEEGMADEGEEKQKKKRKSTKRGEGDEEELKELDELAEDFDEPEAEDTDGAGAGSGSGSDGGNDDDDEKGDEEGSEAVREKKKKKRRHHHRQDDLDEDDLELIKENQEQVGHRRIHRMKEIEREKFIEGDEEEEEEDDYDREPSMSYGEEEEEDFIERREGERERPRKAHDPRRYESSNVLQAVFGADYQEYSDDGEIEKEDINEEELDEEERKILNKKKFEKMFDPAELQEHFRSTSDQNIIQQDIPERLYLRYKGRLCSNQELVDEANWIADKLIQSNRLADQSTESFRKNILKTLEFLRINSFEVMYIHTYKLNEISLKPGELKLQDLWKIYDLDQEWSGIYSRRQLLEKSIEKVQSFTTVSDSILQKAKGAFDKFTLDNLLEYFQYLIKQNPQKELDIDAGNVDEEPELEGGDEEIILTKPKPKKKEPTRPRLNPVIREKNEEFTKRYVLSIDDFVQNLLYQKLKNNPPTTQDILQTTVNDSFVDPSVSKIRDAEAFMNQFCDYQAYQLSIHPIIRQIVYRMYFDKILISTEPTAKGKKEIDIYNINYSVKRIDKRPLNKLDDDIWLRALLCEKEQKITIKFHFRWEDDNINNDEIYNYLRNFYSADIKSKHEPTQQCNAVRAEVISRLLTKFLYPYFERYVRKDVTENAEKKIISHCGRKFKEMLSAAPYTKQSGDDVIYDIKVMSLIPYDGDKIICVIVDKNGELLERKFYNYLLINKQRSPVEFLNKQQREEEDLQRFVENHVPDLLVVGAENLKAQTLIKYLREQSKGWNNDVNRVWIKYGDMTVPKIFAKLDISKKEFSGYAPYIKQAISLGRLQQSPLNEILQLWNHKTQENGVLYIVLHDLQNMLPVNKLLTEYEKVSIEVSNQVGVDINKVISHKHLSKTLQFISGLGPRKAHNLLDRISSRTEKIESRRELNEEGGIGKIVSINMAGFIKVTDEEGYQTDLLEQTRIHPNDYKLAQKIAKDALDDEDVKGDDYVKAIMDKPQKLDDLDLDDYAEHLERKGKINMKIVLDFIVNELTRPFADPRGAHREMDQKELFYKMTKMHPFELQKGSLVSARVTKVTKKKLICRLECGIEGTVFIEDFSDNQQSTSDPSDKYHEGMVIQAKVEYTNFEKQGGEAKDKEDNDFTKLKLTVKPAIVQDHIGTVKLLHPSTELYFKRVPEEDFPHYKSSQQEKNLRYKPRKINHPKFKNTSSQGAMEYLSDKENGDFVIRPSTRGNDNLTITWKFFKNIYVHLDIKESLKNPNDRIGKRLHLKDQAYENLDELIAGYIQPCNSLCENIMESQKFLEEEPAQIQQIVKQEKEADPNLIPYKFGFSPEAPQFLVLFYAPKDYNVISEYIKVKPNGLLFHDNLFPNLTSLIGWFKQNYKTKEYQKYVKFTKAPVQTTSTSHGRKDDPYSRGGYDDQRIKPERDDYRVKKERDYRDEDRNKYGRSNDRYKGGGGGGRDDRRRGGRDDYNNDRRRDKTRSRSNEKDHRRDRHFGGGGGNRDGKRPDYAGGRRDDKREGGGYKRSDSRASQRGWGNPNNGGGAPPSDSWGGRQENDPDIKNKILAYANKGNEKPSDAWGE